MKFVSPYLLYAIGLIIIPIIIHLFNLRKYKTVYFSNVRFLKELKEQTQKQSRLKHLLILLSRILTVVFLVLAFARPYIPESNEIIITDKDFVSVYVDNSYSMEAAGVKGELLQAAKEKAREIFKTYRTSDDFQILDNNFTAINQRQLSKEEINMLVDKIEFSFHSRLLSEVVARQKSLANKNEYTQKFLYIISDFQKNFVDLDNLKTDSTDKIFLIPLQPNQTDNLFIDSIWFENPAKYINQNVVLKARIINKSPVNFEKIPAKLFINKQQKTLASFDINAFSEVIIELPYKITETGIHNAYVEITDYPVIYDDILYFSYEVKNIIDILSINFKNENIFINALFKNDSAFSLTQTNAGSVNYTRFFSYNLIILNEFESISSGLAYELTRYIKNGGSVLLIPSEKTDIDNYNSFFNEMADVSINKADTQLIKINQINHTHPLYKDVFDKIPEDISLPEVRMHFPLTASSQSRTENLLTLQNGDPFLSLFYVEKGSLFVLTSPLNNKFNTFPLHSIFVPSLYNMALNSIYSPPLYYEAGTDNSFTYINTHNNDIKDFFRIKKNDSEFEFIPQFNSSLTGITFVLNDMIEAAGNYYLIHKEDTLCGISFNYSRRESALEYHNSSELKSLVKKHDNIFVLDTLKETIGNAITKINQGVLLWKYCIILALLFLLTEILLLRFLK